MARLPAIPAPHDLDHYDPAKGLKTVAVAEAAEKHFRRAKDATQLCEAVELKLSEQRKFVLWWRVQEKNTGGRKSLSDRKVIFPTLYDLGMDDMTLHRSRIRLEEELHYIRTLQTAQQRAVRICEFRKGSTEQRGASGTEENEWYTPPQYIEAARDVLGAIDLDPASHQHAQQWIRATAFWTRRDDGLTRPWPGRVWLDPPYMQPDIGHFVEKLCGEVEAGRTTAAILLTHNYTDTAWFHRAAGVCAAICFTRGRVAFINADGDVAAPTQGQAFFYYGSSSEAFALRFAAIGLVVKPW